MRNSIPHHMTQEQVDEIIVARARKTGHIVSKCKKNGETHMMLRKPKSWFQSIWFRFLSLIGK